METERAYLSRLERANTNELIEMVVAPTIEEEEVLRTHLGEDCFRRMHRLAVQAAGGPHRGLFDFLGGKESTREKLGNVVVLPGLMGSELTTRNQVSGDEDTIWLSLPRLFFGQVARLRMAADGRSEYYRQYQVSPSGILKRYYGELMLSLAQRWNVRAFWYDWRKDLDTAAAQLMASIDRWFGPKAPVHLVAHSMGGLVARTFIARYPRRWESMLKAGEDLTGASGGRLVMLGTPNYGSYLMVQAATGLAETIRMIERVDQRHDIAGIRTILNSFVGPFQMLPAPGKDGDALYDAATYGDLDVRQETLSQAGEHHEEVLKEVVTPDRLVYVAGSNQPTIDGIANWDRTREPKTRYKKITDPMAYQATLRGDGSVSHRLGQLPGVRTYYVEEEHSALTSNAKVLGALDALLRDGETTALAGGVVVRRARVDIAEIESRRQRDLRRIEDLTRQFGTRGYARRGRSRAAATTLTTEVAEVPESPPLTRLERETTDLIVREVLKRSEGPGAGVAEPEVETDRVVIAVGLVAGSIGKPDDLDVNVEIDALAVGHYTGVRPQNAERALDEYVSENLPGGAAPRRDSATARAADGEGTEGPDEPPNPDLMLTQFTDRGLISGQLGHPFFLPDPNDVQRKRVIAVVGMGEVGRCGPPELTVLARELCWSLGRLGKKHLATVLIGSGVGNLTVRDAVEAWLQGLRQAVRGTGPESPRRLERITFVENDGLRLRDIHDAIMDVRARMAVPGQFEIEYVPIPEGQLIELEEQGLAGRAEKAREALEERRLGGPTRLVERVPTRLTVRLERNLLDPKRATYRFGAITAEASVPERVIALDTTLVGRANDEIAGETSLEDQRERGEFLGRLLIPQDLRGHLSTPAPLVLIVDSDTARVHWEMVAQPDPMREGARRDDEDEEVSDEGEAFDTSFFLGTNRGLTRQLRTSFAGPPEPPPPPQRVLRVLLIADPAEEAPLAGAEAEALAVLSLFEAFNALGGAAGDNPNRIEVTPLLGPYEATPTRALCELTTRSYDIVHYAGHAFFHREHPAQSGWLFSKGVVVSANELERLDRVPSFVFSNACESGITPERAGDRSAEFVPSFAEAFFARGVKNFICTAWPVDDLAARIFAVTLYGQLLGLESVGDAESPDSGASYSAANRRERFQPLHVAMREARRAVARSISGRQTWGAYQHYGNPYTRLFDPSGLGPAGGRPAGG